MVEESKITIGISVGYNCHQWLINRAVHLWETCSIKSVGQCVCQQIALVYFPWRLSPVWYHTCFIMCPAWLHWCVSVVTPRVRSVSDSEGRGGEHVRPVTSALWPRMTLSQLVVCVYQTSAPLAPSLHCLKNRITFITQTEILLVSYDAEVG